MATPRGMPPPAEVDWSLLSPRALETVRIVTLRLAAGLDYAEIARILDVDPPVLRHLDPPTREPPKRGRGALANRP